MNIDKTLCRSLHENSYPLDSVIRELSQTFIPPKENLTKKHSKNRIQIPYTIPISSVSLLKGIGSFKAPVKCCDELYKRHDALG